MFNNPFGFPIIMQGQQSQDPIEQMEKTLALAKKIRDMSKEDEAKIKEKKSLFSKIEWFMLSIAFTSVVQTFLVIWLIKGR